MEFDFPGIGKAFLAPAAVAAVVSWIFQALAKGNVDNYFNQKLEQFKHDLGKLAASAQFEHQRKLRELQAFRGKRHEAYAGVSSATIRWRGQEVTRCRPTPTWHS